MAAAARPPPLPLPGGADNINLTQPPRRLRSGTDKDYSRLHNGEPTTRTAASQVLKAKEKDGVARATRFVRWEFDPQGSGIGVFIACPPSQRQWTRLPGLCIQDTYSVLSRDVAAFSDLLELNSAFPLLGEVVHSEDISNTCTRHTALF